MSNNEKEPLSDKVLHKRIFGGLAIFVVVIGIVLFALTSMRDQSTSDKTDDKVAATKESTKDEPSVQSEIDALLKEDPEDEATSAIESEIEELEVAPEEFVHVEPEFEEIKEHYPDLYSAMEELTEDNLEGVGLLFYDVMDSVNHVDLMPPTNSTDEMISFYYNTNAQSLADYVETTYDIYLSDDHYEVNEYSLDEVVSVAIAYYDAELDNRVEQAIYHFPETSYNGTFTRLNNLTDDSADIYAN